MKAKKLNLDQLKVRSFVTDLSVEKGNTVKGGAAETDKKSDCPLEHFLTNPCICRSEYNCYTLQTKDTYTRA